MSRVRGFTLLELLLVLAMFAAMAAMSLPVIQHLQRQGLATRQHAQTIEAQRAALYWLRQSLRRAEASALAVDAASGRDVLWLADTQSLQWRGMLPVELGLAGAIKQSLTVESKPDGLALVYRFGSAEESDVGQGQEKILLRGLHHVEFAYRRFSSGSQLSEWQTDWPDATRMPVQVRVRLWPEPSDAPLEMQVSLPLSAALQTTSIDAGAPP